MYHALSLKENMIKRPETRPVARELLSPSLVKTGLSTRDSKTTGTNKSAATLKLTNSRTGSWQCGQVLFLPNRFISREKMPIDAPQCGHFIVSLSYVTVGHLFCETVPCLAWKLDIFCHINTPGGHFRHFCSVRKFRGTPAVSSTKPAASSRMICSRSLSAP